MLREVISVFDRAQLGYPERGAVKLLETRSNSDIRPPHSAREIVLLIVYCVMFSDS